jgi:hypothetical protein
MAARSCQTPSQVCLNFSEFMTLTLFYLWQATGHFAAVEGRLYFRAACEAIAPTRVECALSKDAWKSLNRKVKVNSRTWPKLIGMPRNIADHGDFSLMSAIVRANRVADTDIGLLNHLSPPFSTALENVLSR